MWDLWDNFPSAQFHAGLPSTSSQQLGERGQLLHLHSTQGLSGLRVRPVPHKPADPMSTPTTSHVQALSVVLLQFQCSDWSRQISKQLLSQQVPPRQCLSPRSSWAGATPVGRKYRQYGTEDSSRLTRQSQVPLSTSSSVQEQTLGCLHAGVGAGLPTCSRHWAPCVR